LWYSTQISSVFSKKFLDYQNLKIIDNFKIGELPLEIDLILHLTDKNYVSIKLPGMKPIVDIIQLSGTNGLVIEYKSQSDRLTIPDVYKLEGYRNFYLMNEYKHYNSEDIGKLVICTNKPKSVLDKFKSDLISKGIYKLQTIVPVYIIIINELEYNQDNLNILLFSSGKTKKRRRN